MKHIKFLAAGMIAAGLISIAAGSSFFLSDKTANRPEKTFNDYMREADVYFKDDSMYKALVSYENALALESENLDALLGLAEVYNRQGNYDKEIEIRKKIAELYPDELDNQIRLIEVLIHVEEYDEAKSIASALIKNHDSDKLRLLYEQMNVEAPVFNLSGGSYEDYQLLLLENTDPTSTVRYTVDGSEPTMESPSYVDGIIISHPETTVRAIAVSSLGFSSEETALEFEITKPVEEIKKYTDLYYLTRNYLIEINGDDSFDYYDSDTVIYNYDAAQVRTACLIGDYTPRVRQLSATFYSEHYDIGNTTLDYYGDSSLSFVSYTPFLHTLSVGYQKELDLTPLESLQYLQNLSLLNDSISDLSPLAELPSLERLALGWNEISDVSPLAELTSLYSLGLWNNDISDISPLGELKQLEYLDIAHNDVSDISIVSGMTNLREVWINDNQITSLAPLDSCPLLSVLMMAGNPVSDYGTLQERSEQLDKTDLGQ